MRYAIILCLFMTFTLSAQEISVGYDVKNAFKGGTVNPPALDILIKVSDITDHREIGLVVEYFDYIEYFSWGIFGNYVARHKNFQGSIGGEFIHIIRKNVGALTVGGNAELSYYYKQFGFGVEYNYKYRNDLNVMYSDGRWVGSVYMSLKYNWRK